MFTTPIPRRSFLDSRLRTQSRETRHLSRGYAIGDSHLGLGSRATSARPSNRVRYRGGYGWGRSSASI